VPHCHVHIIPRKFNDYKNNDDIYKDIERSQFAIDDEERKPRSLEEMAKEAEYIRRFFTEDNNN
jgi:bis(5'-adenosyl)-triphosphatase